MPEASTGQADDPPRAAAAGRILALDVGSVRVGLAMSDPAACIAQPHAVWPRHQPRWAERLAALVAAYEVRALVVGRPLRLNGETGPAVAQVESFVAVLRPGLDVPIIWWDERLSTRGAERAMIGAGVRRRARREQIDKVAAAWFLQGYLDAQGGHL